MNIQKAVRKAMKIDGYIARKSWRHGDARILAKKKECTCYLVVADREDNKRIDSERLWRSYPSWNPSPDDLTANDWYVVRNLKGKQILS